MAFSYQYSDLQEIIKPSNYDPFYTPMGTATPAMLGVLADFYEKTPPQSNIAYHEQLLKCQLDYSLSSLKRLDKFIIAFKNHQAKLNAENAPLDDDVAMNNLFMLLVAYVGEVFARARGQTALWFHSSEIENLTLLQQLAEQNFQQHFQNSGLVYFENLTHDDPASAFIVLFGYDKQLPTKQNLGVFFASFPVYQVLAGEQYISFYDYVVNFLVKIGEPIPADNQIPKPFSLYVEVGLAEQLNSLTPIQRYYLQIKKPTWVDENNLLFQQFKNLGNLYKNGKVVWAVIVQANKEMYSLDGLHDGKKSQKIEGYPAEIIYDPAGRTHLTELIQLAEKLYDLKNTTPNDPALAKLAERITGEIEYAQGMDYPKAFTSLALKISTIFVWRLHLPNGLLSMKFLPILIDETHEGVVTVLPSRFWREDFVRLWLDSQHDLTHITWSLDGRIRNRESQNVPAWSVTSTCSLPLLTNPALMPQLTELFPDHQHNPSEIKFVEEQPITITLPQKGEGFVAIKRDGSVTTGIVGELNREELLAEMQESDRRYRQNLKDIGNEKRNGVFGFILDHPIIFIISVLFIFQFGKKLL